MIAEMHQHDRMIAAEQEFLEVGEHRVRLLQAF